MIEFTMPKLGLTMEEATIVEWLVGEGDPVVAGTPVIRIETDKVDTEVESSGSGTLHQVGQPGDVFACGQVIGYFLGEGEAPPAGQPAATATAPPAAVAPAATVASTPVAAVPTATTNGRQFVSPNARRVATLAGVDVRSVAGTGPGGRVVSEDVEAAAASAAARPAAAPLPRASGAGADIVASLAARNLADLLGIDLRAVPADPVERRVTRDAVAAYVRARLDAARTPSPADAQPAPAALAPLLQAPTRTVPMTGMRGTIAKRMHASLREMAQLTLTMDAAMDAVVADRELRKAGGATPGYTDYVVAAAARALRSHPNVNAQVTGEGIALLPDIHVGLAVALDHGLIVPVVRNADRQDLATLAAETSRLAAAARGGTLTPAELEGGTFSVSALGMFGVDAFTPVINPPNVAILGVGRLRDELSLVDDQVVQSKRLTLSLTWDHRVLDGAPAAAFCRAIVDLLADPAALDQPS